MSLGRRITELRSMQNLSQNQLAKLMDVSRQAVSKWETDQSAPDSIKMIHLAEVLDTDIEYSSTALDEIMKSHKFIRSIERYDDN